MTLIDTQSIQKKFEEEITQNIKLRTQKSLPELKLLIILASQDEPSIRYTNLKMKKAEELGIRAEIKNLYHEGITADEVITQIQKANADESVSGIILQTPVANEIYEDQNQIIDSIDPKKDADCLTSANLGKIILGNNKILPATVAACVKVIEEIKFDYQGKNILIINNTSLIGRPVASYFSAKNATVTIANKFSKNLEELISKADLILSATGVGHLIKSELVQDNAVLIDVTSNKTENGIIGDFKNDEIMQSKNVLLTPVPKGVGPITILCLLDNLIKLND